MNKKVFYDAVRKMFGGIITQEQFAGFETILDEWAKRGLTDLRWLAYIIATVYHETAHTMQPIAEIGKGRGRKYGIPDKNGNTYYGRGYVQLTWRVNYAAFGERYHIDLVNQPDLALKPDIAVAILFDGMIEGIYTGVGLPKYFGKTADWVNARRIVNGTDRAGEIAVVARGFNHALETAMQFSADEDAKITEVTTTTGEALTMIEHEHPQPAQLAPEPESSGGWLSGKKTHIGMLISGGLGIAAMLGYIPGMTPDQGADMLQTAFGVSGIRSALPGLIKLAITQYMRTR